MSMFRTLRRALVVPIALGAMVATMAADCTPAMTPDSVDHAFLNSFYAGAQMSPSTESDAITSCYSAGSVGGSKRGFICRNVYNSDFRNQDYLIDKAYVKVASSVSGAGYGIDIVADNVPGIAQKGGPTSWFEGCTDRGTYYSCDYRSAWQAFYELNGRGYAYGALFRNWSSVVKNQALCASSVSATWSSSAAIGAAGWVSLLGDCGTSPYKGGNPWRATP